MNFSRDYWERVLRTFYTSAIAVGGPLVVAHLAGAMEDVASGSWHSLKSVGITIGAAAVSAGFTAVKGMIAKGLGTVPDSGSLKGAFKNGA